MLDITPITRQALGKVVSYYADGADDYYSKDGTAMEWQGAGAALLDLAGPVDRDRFRELLDGKIDEHTRTRRIPPASADARKERLAYDLTFSAPKGVSLQALVHGDHRIVQAHDKAVAAAIKEAERLALARTTIHKKTSVENTHNLVVAKFRHETSRALDPDLHTHAVVLNLTRRKDGQWRALTSDGMVKSLRHLGNIYKAELAKELQKQGFTLRFDRNGTFDLAHFTEHQIQEFSARSQQIEQALASKGLTRETASHAEKNHAALSTRQKKVEVNRDELRREWQRRAEELKVDFMSRGWAGAEDGAAGRPSHQRVAPAEIDKPLEYHADQAVKFAVQSLTERSAIVKRTDLVETALRHGFGRLSDDDIGAAIKRLAKSGHLIQELPTYTSMNPTQKSTAGSEGASLSRAEWIAKLVATGRSRADSTRLVDQGIRNGRLKISGQRFTTHVAQMREREILRLERTGRQMAKSYVGPNEAKAFIEQRSLNQEQKRAVEMIATTNSRFIGVQGFAGTGKTHMTQAARDLLEQSGYRVTSMAPYGSQVKSLQEAGMDSRTVQAFLRAKDKKIDSSSVIFIDEAGVMPARQMLEVMKVIEQHGARAIFIGDTAQTKAIEAGKPFDQLQKAGMETARMAEIQRQKDPELLRAVELAAQGKTAASIAHVREIKEVSCSEKRYATIVDRFAQLSPAERAQTLVITGTNASRKELNTGIRAAIGLEGKGREYPLLNRLDTTQAERRHSRYYTKGAVIVPERTYSNGLSRGQHYRIIDTGPGNLLTVRAEDNTVIKFCPARAPKLSVYSVERTELAVGDEVKITRNDAQADLANGDRFRVTRINDKEISLAGKNGRQITMPASKDLFLAPAYVSTVHAAQGMTCDRVFINMETKSRTTTKDVYYVGISRARADAVIYTDDRSKLAEAIGRDSLKNAALEIKQLVAHGAEKREKAVQLAKATNLVSKGL